MPTIPPASAPAFLPATDSEALPESSLPEDRGRTREEDEEDEDGFVLLSAPPEECRPGACPSAPRPRLPTAMVMATPKEPQARHPIDRPADAQPIKGVKVAEGKERLEILGQRFRDVVLGQVVEDCERTLEKDRQDALKLLRNTFSGEPAEALLDRMVALLQGSRLTINFKLHEVRELPALYKEREYKNCFAVGEARGQPPGYSVGRAQLEESTLGIRRLLQTSAFRDFGRYESERNATIRQPLFQWTSRPLYAALDFLKGPHGGASHYGKSFLVLAKHMRNVSTFSPVDTFATTRLVANAVTPDKVCTWHHFPRLVAHAQRDKFGYNCLRNLYLAATGQPKSPPPSGYGKGGQNNHIEAQVHGRLVFGRDVEAVHVSMDELHQLTLPGQRDKAIEAMKAENRELGRNVYVFIDDQ